jgi:hypothetical protein
MLNPTWRHTPLVDGNFENDYDEVTTNIKGRSFGRTGDISKTYASEARRYGHGRSRLLELPKQNI